MSTIGYVLVAVVVAVLSAVLTMAAMPDQCDNEDEGPVVLKGCSDSTMEALVEQAKEDREKMKATLEEYKIKAIAAEDLIGAVESDAFTVPLGNEWNLYVNKRYGFMLRLPRAYDADSGSCEIDQDGMHNISRDTLPIVAVEDRAAATVHLVSAYHYTAERQGNQTTCVQVNHDLEAIQSPEVFISAIMPISIREGMSNREAILSYVRQEFGSSCDVLLDSVTGTSDDPIYQRVILVGGGEGSDCADISIYRLFHRPDTGRLFVLKLGAQPVFGDLTAEIADSLVIY